MERLCLAPIAADYSAQDGAGSLSVKLDGGASYFRQEQLCPAALVQVTFVCDLTQFRYLKAFYRTATAAGSLPFEIDLILDDAAAQRYEAHFVPGSLQVKAVRGYTRTVGAQLEVVPATVDATSDRIVIDAFAGTAPPPAPVIFGVPSPMIADFLPVGGSCHPSTVSVRLYLDDVLVATVTPTRPIGTSWKTELPGPADGMHHLTATAVGAGGVASAVSKRVSFYQGASAAAASYTLDGLEFFDDT